MHIRKILLIPSLLISLNLFSAMAVADDSARISGGGATLQRKDSTTLQRIDPSAQQRTESPTLQRMETPTLQRTDTPTLQKPDSSTLQRTDSTTLQRTESPTLQRMEPGGLPNLQNPSSSARSRLQDILSHSGAEPRYRTYRDGFLKRHLSREGRDLSWVWLTDIDSSPQAQAFAARARQTTFAETVRLDTGQSQAFTIAKTYIPWTYASGADTYIYGGDENPLLHGGLAMAAFALEYLCNRNDQSLKAAIQLLQYAMESEYVANSGQRTGFFLRTKWPGAVFGDSNRPYFYASADELSGLIYGLFWLNRALAVAPMNYQAEHNDLKALAVRFAQQLQSNGYLIMPPDSLTQEHQQGARELHRGWAGLFGLQWFVEEAFVDITDQRFEATNPKKSLEAVKDFTIVGGKAEDAELVKLMAKIAPEYSSFDRATALIKFLGIMLYQEGRPITFECKALFIKVNETKVTIPYEYFNFTYMLHLAQIGLQRHAEGKSRSADDLVREMRRLTRGVIFADQSQTGFDADEFALAYATNGLLHRVAGVLFAAIDWLPGTGCNLKDKHVGSRSEQDFNYYVLAVAHAYNLMDGDSNPVFRNELPLRIEQARAQFGPDLPLSERKDAYTLPRVFAAYTPGVWWPQAFDRRAARGGNSAEGRDFIAYHNMAGFIGGAFAWEHEPNARKANGGADGDEGLCQSEIMGAWAKGLDVVREGPGLDYLLPTAILAYQKGGQFSAEVKAVGNQAYPSLSASTLTPKRALTNPPAPRSCGEARPVPQYAANSGGTGRLSAGDVLFGDNAVVSQNGLYALVQQTDGNLVLYKNTSPSSRTALWAAGTTGAQHGAMSIFQGDGNLVVYDSSVFKSQSKLHAVWASNTDGNPGSHLDVQNDGNVVIYAPDGRVVWATNTMQH